MATDYPTALDTSSKLPNPTGSNTQTSPDHAGLHTNVQDAVKAVEAKLGTGATTPATNTLLIGTGLGTSAWTQVTSAQLAATLSDETGTGSAVFANTPVLITPKVDTINESTLNNGVTVGGVNLKAGAITGTLPGSSLGVNSVDASRIKWSATGANAGIWWEELGRVTASSTVGTLTTLSFTSRKYLRAIFLILPSTTIVSCALNFNADVGANYAYRLSDNGGADSTGIWTGGIPIDVPGTQAFYGEVDILDVTSQEKHITGLVTGGGSGTGTGNITNRRLVSGKWASTARITSVGIKATSSILAAGSEIVVLGHD